METTTPAASNPSNVKPPPPRRPPWLATRLSVQMFVVFAVQGAWIPVFSVHLNQLGFSPTASSWAFASYALSALVAPLVWGQVADRWVPAERCISLCAVVNTLLLALMSVLIEPWAMFTVSLLFWFFMIPATSLGTALTLRQLEHPEQSFGRVRLWGTLGWMSAGLLLTGWLHLVKPMLFAPSETPGLRDCFWLAACFTTILSLYSLTLPSTPPSLPGQRSDDPAVRLRGLERFLDAPLTSLRLFRRRAFLTYCVCLFGFYVTLPFSVQLTPLLLERIGIDRDLLPMAMTVAQITEVATLVFLPWMLRRLGSRTTMLVGGVGWTLGMAAFSVGRPTALVVAAMTMQGLLISCYLVAGQVFVNRQSAPDVRASAQGLVVLCSGGGLLGGNLLVGWIRDLTGDDFHLAFVPAAVLSVVLVVVFLTGYTEQSVGPAKVDSLVPNP